MNVHENNIAQSQIKNTGSDDQKIENSLLQSSDEEVHRALTGLRVEDQKPRKHGAARKRKMILVKQLKRQRNR